MSIQVTKLPNPKGLEFIYHGDHLEVIRTDGKTPTLKDIAIRDAWFEYLKKKADNLRHCPVLNINEGL